MEQFSEEQFSQIYPDGIEYHFWNHSRNKIILRFLKKSGKQKEQILEIGGGRGIVSRFLHENNFHITGIEKAKVAPVTGTEGYFHASIDAFELPEDKRKNYTVILLCDVIEHIADPEEFLRKIMEFFPSLHTLVITVPACNELWSNYDEFNGHYRRYYMKDLKPLLPDLLTLVQASYFDHLLYPVFYWYARVLHRRNTEIASPKGFITIATHKFLSWILQTDFLVFPSKWRGTSLIGAYTINRDFIR
jgi:2-polyprenyl-3-methyl-5-hydroxy-6-metoxy-1,4-benzoquinol methylase